MYIDAKQRAKEVREALKANGYTRKNGYKFSVTSDYNSVTVYILAAPFDMGNERDGESVRSWDFKEYDEAATPMLKTIFETLDEGVEDANAGDPTADYCNYNLYTWVYIGRYDKPFANTANS